MFNAFGCFFFSCLPATTRVSQNVRFRPEAQPRDVCWRPLQSHKTASTLCFRGKNKQTQNEFAQHVIEHSSKRQERRVSCCPRNIHPGPHILKLCLIWSLSASSLYFLHVAGVPFSPHGGLLLVIRAAKSAEILTAVDRRALSGTQRLLAYHSVQPIG